MTRIAMLCPTMGRPQLLREMIDSVIRTADDIDNISIFLALTDCDDMIDEYRTIVGEKKELGFNISISIFPDWTLPMCHNMLAQRAASFDICFPVGDDLKFSTPAWDKALRDQYEALDNKIHVWSFLDSRDPEGNPAPAISREYIEAMGYLIPPIFMHWYCDTWTGAIARHAKCFTHLKEYLLVHDKKSEQGIEDETYNRIRRLGAVDRDTMVNQTCQHFLELEKTKLARIMGVQ